MNTNEYIYRARAILPRWVCIVGIAISALFICRCINVAITGSLGFTTWILCSISALIGAWLFVELINTFIGIRKIIVQDNAIFCPKGRYSKQRRWISYNDITHYNIGSKQIILQYENKLWFINKHSFINTNLFLQLSRTLEFYLQPRIHARMQHLIEHQIFTEEVKPPWEMYPGFPPYDFFWRDAGQPWMDYCWRPYWKSLDIRSQQQYLKRWQPPKEWRAHSPDFNPKAFIE